MSAIPFGVGHTISSVDFHAHAARLPPVAFPPLVDVRFAAADTSSESSVPAESQMMPHEKGTLDLLSAAPKRREELYPYIPSDVTVYPYKCVGKLAAIDAYGTAAMVGQNVIITAAHVVMATGTTTIKSDINFQPHYPVHGVWYPIDKVFVHPDWPKRWHDSVDVAIAITRVPMPVQRVSLESI